MNAMQAASDDKGALFEHLKRRRGDHDHNIRVLKEKKRLHV